MSDLHPEPVSTPDEGVSPETRKHLRMVEGAFIAVLLVAVLSISGYLMSQRSDSPKKFSEVASVIP